MAVYFDQAVDIDIGGGIPRILLETGTTDEYASYSSGSGSNVIEFSYTVQAGDVSADLQYGATTSLTSKAGAITSVANGSSADVTLPSFGLGQFVSRRQCPGDRHQRARRAQHAGFGQRQRQRRLQQ